MTTSLASSSYPDAAAREVATLPVAYDGASPQLRRRRSSMERAYDVIQQTLVLGRRKVFGRSTDGLNDVGVFILICNTMNGPGILAVPFVYQMGGLVVPTVALVLIAWVSVVCGSLFSAALATAKARQESVALNSGTRAELEFCGVIRLYFGRRVEVLSQIMLTVCLTSLALAQMVVGCQTMDAFIVFCGGKTYGLQYAPKFELLSSAELSLQPFGTGRWMVSAGFAVCCVVCLALGRLNLSENLLPQVLSFLLFVFSIVVFFWYFARPETAEPKVSNLNGWVGSEVAGVLGVVIFNFSYVVAVPSLANEKADRVQMWRPILRAVVFMLVIYLVMGLLGDAAFADEESDILATILDPDPESGETPQIAKFAVFAFVHAIVPCIPLYCVLIGYNLREGFGVGATTAYLLSNVVPWGIALILTYQPFFSALVGWSSLLVSGFVNFTIPLLLVLKVRVCHAESVEDDADFDRGFEAPFIEAASRPLVQGIGEAERSSEFERVEMTFAKVRALSRRDPDTRKALAVLILITSLLVFTIILNLVYWVVLGKDYVAGAGGGSHKPWHP